MSRSCKEHGNSVSAPATTASRPRRTAAPTSEPHRPFDVRDRSSRYAASRPCAWFPCCGNNPEPGKHKSNHQSSVGKCSVSTASLQICFLSCLIRDSSWGETHLEDLVHVEADVKICQSLVQLLLTTTSFHLNGDNKSGQKLNTTTTTHTHPGRPSWTSSLLFKTEEKVQLIPWNQCC